MSIKISIITINIFTQSINKMSSLYSSDVYFTLKQNYIDIDKIKPDFGSYELIAYMYIKEHKQEYLFKIIKIDLTVYTEEQDDQDYSDTSQDNISPFKYRIMLYKFYNFFNSHLHDFYQKISPEQQQKIKGLAYSLLCYFLTYLKNTLSLNDDDKIILEASGYTHRKERNLLSLYDFYKSIGFQTIDPKYIERYKLLINELETLEEAELKRRNEKRDEPVDEQEQILKSSVIEQLNQKYYADSTYIPMFAYLKDVLKLCLTNTKQEIKCEYFNKPDSCKIITKIIT
jgi:hypothetical protein